MSAGATSAALKRWPGWLAMAMVLAALLAIGIARASEPRTADERQLAIYERIACPVCDGESVAESRAESAVQIRAEVDRLVADGQLTDSEIVARIDGAYIEDLALTPSGSGIDLLVWVLPSVAIVGAVAGLYAAFSRWRRMPGTPAPSDEDVALVEAARAVERDRP
jgi:cytochrome c-type biogenesis protein CcmH